MVDELSWLQCDECAKWRIVEPAMFAKYGGEDCKLRWTCSIIPGISCETPADG